MYNDEQNLYHYTYRKDGSESGQQNAGPAGDGAVGAAETDSGDEACEKEPHGIKSHSAGPVLCPIGRRIGRRHCVGSKSGNQRGHGPGQRPNRQPGIPSSRRRSDSRGPRIRS